MRVSLRWERAREASYQSTSPTWASSPIVLISSRLTQQCFSQSLSFPRPEFRFSSRLFSKLSAASSRLLCEEQIGDSSSRSRTIDLVTTRREAVRIATSERAVKSKFLCTPGGASSDARPPHPMVKRRAQIRRSVAVETAQVGWKSSATRFEFASKEDVDRGKQLINVFAPQLSHRSTASSATRRGALGAAAVDPLRRCLQWPALLGPLGVESNDMETAEEIAGARRGCLLLRLAARLDPGTIRGCSR